MVMALIHVTTYSLMFPNISVMEIIVQSITVLYLLHSL